MDDRLIFRAWDKWAKKMLNVTDLTFYEDVSHVSVGILGGGFNSHYDGFVLMQSVAIRDHNYNLAFDGDIIRMSEEADVSPNKLLVIEIDEFGDRWVRPPNSRFYSGHLMDCCKDSLGNFKTKHGLAGEIIGDIHRNPELLELSQETNQALKEDLSSKPRHKGTKSMWDEIGIDPKP